MTSIALVVGINQYADPNVPNLRQCVMDAESFAGIISEPEYAYEVELLLDEQATQRQIRLRSYKLRQRKPENFLLFFAGHGALVGERGYLVTSDGTEGDYGIEISNLSEILDLNGVGRSLAILDCCHSGGGLPWRGRLPATSQTLFRDGRVSTGQALLAACRSDQLAAESKELGHGRLTYFVLQALLGGAVDQHGEITLPAVYNYVCRGFEDDLDQKPVLKVQIEDRYVLGRNFEPGPKLVDVDATIEQTIRSAQARIESLHHAMGVDADAWRNGGWIRASSLLEDLIRWKNAKTKALPELLRSRDFGDVLASIDGYLTRLAALQQGTLVHDGIVRSAIGSGAFGHVYKIEDREQEFAYKVYNSNELTNAMKVERFRRGFRAMSKLAHPNIVSVHSFTEAPLGFVMDFIPGPNLRELGRELADFSERLQFFKTICQAVGYAHQAGVLHRDIKPENVIVAYGATGTIEDVHLTDFDLAWFSTATTSIVADGGIGTIWYAAPEQLHHPDAKKARSQFVDIYSLGQLLFFLMTDRDPASMVQARNIAILDGCLVSQMESALGRKAIVDLYRACTEESQRLRPTDTDAILNVVDELVLNFVDVAYDRSLDVPTFLGEVANRVAGRLGDVESVSSELAVLKSASNRVAITLTPKGVGGGNMTIVARFAPTESLLVGGADTFADARVIVNRRLDGRIQRLAVPAGTRVRRRRGNAPNYETFIDIAGVPSTSKGAQICTEIVGSISSLLDQYCA